MRKQTIIALAAALGFFVLPAEKPKPLSTEQLAEITTRGRLLFEYDQAAWHASDSVLATKPDDSKVEGYVAQKSGTVWTVAFGRFNGKRDRFLIAYEAFQAADPRQFTVKALDPPKEDSGFILAAATALDIALKDFQRPNRPYNTMVLPASGGQMYVYLVPAQTEPGRYPLGGDVRYLFSADGKTFSEKRQLHASILEVTESAKPGQTLAARFHTHVLSDVPEDTDVFHVLRQENPLPETVSTRHSIYRVNKDGTIAVVK